MPPRKPRELPEGLPRREAYAAPHWEIEDAGALQALNRGEAEPHQQQRAMKYIIEVLAGAYDMSFRPESDRSTCFAEGRRFVGNRIVFLTKVNLAKLQGKPNEQG